MRITVFIVSLVLFAGGLFLSYLDQTASAIATYGAAILCLIFVFLSQFESFEGLGIKAKLLDRKIAEADEVLSKLKGITMPMAEMLLSTAARMGRWGSQMSRRQKHDLLLRIEEELAKCGVSKDELEGAKEDWHFYNVFDLSVPIRKRVQEALQPKLRAREEDLARFPSPITPDRREEHEALIRLRDEALEEENRLIESAERVGRERLADELEQMISESKLFSAEEKQQLLESCREELEDIRYYNEHKKFRRPDAWFSSSD